MGRLAALQPWLHVTELPPESPRPNALFTIGVLIAGADGVDALQLQLGLAQGDHPGFAAPYVTVGRQGAVGDRS